MSPDPNSTSRSNRSGRIVLKAGSRIIADLLIITLWVLLLALVVLTIGLSQWVFYAALLVGVGLYVQITASWW